MRWALVMALASSIALGHPVQGDGGVALQMPDDAPYAQSAEFAEMTTSDGTVIQSGPGVWLNREAAKGVAASMADLQAQNESLKKDFDTIEAGAPPWLVAVIAVLAFGGGVVTVKLLSK